jgi:hypothetical protein
MVDDILREGSHEVVDNESVRKAISKKTALVYKEYLKCVLCAINNNLSGFHLEL